MSDLGSTITSNADSVASTASSDASSAASAFQNQGVVAGLSNVGDSAETGADSILSGGNLQRAYLLILPPSSPAGGMAAAALGAAGIAAEDMAGASGGATNSSVANGAETQFSGTVGNRIDFMFNPKEYKVEKSASWSHEIDAGSRPTATPVWKGSKQRSLSMEMILDTTTGDQRSIQTDVELLFSCLQPTILSLVMESPSPPFVIFGWGESLSFLAYMESVSVNYQLFLPNGTPVRATCSLSMKEIPVGLASQNPTSGGRARRTRRLVAGDTLQSISQREYGKPTMWRAIASANGIEDPTRVAPGTTVLIPPRSDAASTS
ncbi:MAG TPA: LysM peptidoglycan-binding domain-containing protein [Acidimicrobiales bacterium]|nr:LysM peptidoglycan-binding domain-containing protein [Acidimicrobiales bacterium]